MADFELRDAIPTELDMATAYRILRLRVDVFVVEQECPYPELDGRDLEPSARWVWAESDGQVLGTLRILRDADGRARIGRVVTNPAVRSSGTGAVLMNRALELIGPEVGVVLDAQAHLEGWYARFGFARSGKPFVEDGIPHVPMSRTSEHAGVAGWPSAG
jgi:ElaA protein